MKEDFTTAAGGIGYLWVEHPNRPGSLFWRANPEYVGSAHLGWKKLLSPLYVYCPEATTLNSNKFRAVSINKATSQPEELRTSNRVGKGRAVKLNNIEGSLIRLPFASGLVNLTDGKFEILGVLNGPLKEQCNIPKNNSLLNELFAPLFKKSTSRKTLNPRTVIRDSQGNISALFCAPGFVLKAAGQTNHKDYAAWEEFSSFYRNPLTEEKPMLEALKTLIVKPDYFNTLVEEGCAQALTVRLSL